jgi:hypothetical protein
MAIDIDSPPSFLIQTFACLSPFSDPGSLLPLKVTVLELVDFINGRVPLFFLGLVASSRFNPTIQLICAVRGRPRDLSMHNFAYG